MFKWGHACTLYPAVGALVSGVRVLKFIHVHSDWDLYTYKCLHLDILLVSSREQEILHLIYADKESVIPCNVLH